VLLQVPQTRHSASYCLCSPPADPVATSDFGHRLHLDRLAWDDFAGANLVGSTGQRGCLTDVTASKAGQVRICRCGYLPATRVHPSIRARNFGRIIEVAGAAAVCCRRGKSRPVTLLRRGQNGREGDVVAPPAKDNNHPVIGKARSGSAIRALVIARGRDPSGFKLGPKKC